MTEKYLKSILDTWKIGDRVKIIDTRGSMWASVSEEFTITNIITIPNVNFLKEAYITLQPIIPSHKPNFNMNWWRCINTNPLRLNLEFDFKVGDTVLVVEDNGFSVTGKNSFGKIKAISPVLSTVEFLYLNNSIVHSRQEVKTPLLYDIENISIIKLDLTKQIKIKSKLNEEIGILSKIEDNKVYARWKSCPTMDLYLDIEVVDFLELAEGDSNR